MENFQLFVNKQIEEVKKTWFNSKNQTCLDSLNCATKDVKDGVKVTLHSESFFDLKHQILQLQTSQWQLAINDKWKEICRVTAKDTMSHCKTQNRIWITENSLHFNAYISLRESSKSSQDSICQALWVNLCLQSTNWRSNGTRIWSTQAYGQKKN